MLTTMDTTLTASVAACLIVSLLVWSLKTKSSDLQLPPGPRQIPFLGNALSIDISKPHITYTQWGHQYGLSSAVNTFSLLNLLSILLRT